MVFCVFDRKESPLSSKCWKYNLKLNKSNHVFGNLVSFDKRYEDSEILSE